MNSILLNLVMIVFSFSIAFLIHVISNYFECTIIILLVY